ncbi:response regulator [Candidatus Woesearchaeota archaeon]|nr:response regulator [Candidatus Woesearchaeota archaeon]
MHNPSISSKNRNYRVLTITGDYNKKIIIEQELLRRGYGSITSANDEDIAVIDCDLAIIDMADTKGGTFLENIKEQKPSLPLIALVHEDSTLDYVKSVIRKGADTYLMSSSLKIPGYIIDTVIKMRAKNPTLSAHTMLDLRSYVSKGSYLSLDDDQIILDSLEYALDDSHHYLFRTNNEQSALKALRQNKINVALIDKTLGDSPEDKNAGIVFAERLRKYSSDIGIIMLTGQGHIEDIKSLEGIADSYLTKPYDEDELVKKIDIVDNIRINGITGKIGTWNPKICVLFGPHGSGKTTYGKGIASLLHSTGRVITTTNRHPKEGEIEGLDHYFGFDLHPEAKDYLLLTHYRGQYKLGISYNEIQRHIDLGLDAVVNLSPNDPQEVIESLRLKFGGDSVISIGVLTENWRDLKTRLEERDKEKVDRNFLIDQWGAYNSLRDKFDFYIINKTTDNEWDIFNNIGYILNFIKAQRTSSKRGFSKMLL